MTFDPASHLSAAEAARKSQTKTGPAIQITVFTFAWEQDWYALPLGDVREVITLQHVTSIPGLPEYLVGATNHRGEVIAVVDGRPLLGMSPGKITKESYLAIIDTGEELAGLLIDQTGDIHEVTPVNRANDAKYDHPAFTSVAMLSDANQILTLIDLTQLITQILATV